LQRDRECFFVPFEAPWITLHYYSCYCFKGETW